MDALYFHNKLLSAVLTVFWRRGTLRRIGAEVVPGVAVVVHRRERVRRQSGPRGPEAVVVSRALPLAASSEVMGVVRPHRVVRVLLQFDEGGLGAGRRTRCVTSTAFEGPHPSVVVLVHLRAHRVGGRRVRSARTSFPERAPKVCVVQRGGLSLLTLSSDTRTPISKCCALRTTQLHYVIMVTITSSQSRYIQSRVRGESTDGGRREVRPHRRC